MLATIEPRFQKLSLDSNDSNPQQFARLVGEYKSKSFEHDHGVHIVLNTEANGVIYPIDVNIQSTDGTSVDYSVRSELLNWGFEFPDGIDTDVSLSYVNDLNLTDADFNVGTEPVLAQMLSNLATTSDKIIAYGMMYTDCSAAEANPAGANHSVGFHDIHYNTPGCDGAIGFATLEGSQKRILWVYFKFQNQHLQQMQE